MRVLRQHVSLPVENLDVLTSTSEETANKHGPLFPSTLRSVICGPSGAGKTNVLLSLLFDANGLWFENVYVYSKSLYQPKYQLLEGVLKKVKGVRYYAYTDNDSVIDPSEARINSIFIFDDVACDKQDKIRAYFCMGRHKHVDCFYLCQTYTRIPKHLIRDNCNCIILFKQDKLNMRHVFDDHVVPDMSFEKFENMCATCWQDKYGVLVIIKDFDLNNGRYRKGFDHYITI